MNLELITKYTLNRIIIIDGEITDELSYNVVCKLIELNNQDASKDIFILINSNGGKTTAAMAIYDVIKWCRCNICTIAVGEICAIAGLLLVAGTKGKRYICIEAVLVPTLYTYAKEEGIDKNITILEEIIIKIIKEYAVQTDHSFEEMRNVLFTEYYLSAEDTVKYGFSDYLIDIPVICNENEFNEEVLSYASIENQYDHLVTYLLKRYIK